MIRVVVEVSDGALLRRLVVQSRSIQGALSLVEEHHIDGGEARIVFPIEPEPFFVRNPGAIVGLVEIEKVAELSASSTQDHTGQRPDGERFPPPDVTAASRTGGGVTAASEDASGPVEDGREAVKDTDPGLSHKDSHASARQKGGTHT